MRKTCKSSQNHEKLLKGQIQRTQDLQRALGRQWPWWKKKPGAVRDHPRVVEALHLEHVVQENAVGEFRTNRLDFVRATGDDVPPVAVVSTVILNDT